MLNYTQLETIIGVPFRDREHLLTAMTHRSFLNENRDATQEHNERYEFLGDAVLELIVTDYLFRMYPKKPEGELTAIRSAVVNTLSLASASTHLNLDAHLLMSKGEAKDTGRARQYLLANAFEAIVGALYLDQGYDVARDFVARNLYHNLDEIVTNELWKDSKSRLQELAQEKVGVTPSYKTIDQSGPDHDRVFTVGAFFGTKEVARGTGHSKQEAEQAAAEEAIRLQFGS